ncbi:Crp/Fnr family transcriptional regulator [Croceivirga lutea]|uniref:Crp/Fnr family transcriptional regulator n=1 Tax=Croceivirga lutea TaxID=1775167 RepID=UPI0016396BF8|nr:Crp/Fnr family transcriptional regulator [Croceivirga lutea]GGG45162.1 Crp/Fnr family transcriptional regulator [Croceivirga lutea]
MQPSPAEIKQVFNTVSLPATAVEHIGSKFAKIELVKDDVLITANDIVTTQYYVLTGCLRTFYLAPNGKEHTLQFAINDWWISDYTAYFEGSRAIMTIEVIEACTLLKITKANLDRLYEEFPVLEAFFRKKLEKAFASFQKRILANLALPAKERYLQFMHTYPNIEQHVKNYHIASYLGITTESLSRIRKELANT